MTRDRLATLLVLALILGVGYLAGLQLSAPPPARTPVVRCEEDMACWNCHTDGNMRCGPGAG